jgi:3-oxoacyl-[acyl-carrier-protein] synthase III
VGVGGKTEVMMKPLIGVEIRGISTAVPKNVVKTADYTVLSEKEREKFSLSTGIEQRHIVVGNQCSSDLCIAAAEDLLEKLEWDKSTVQALVMITQTGDHPVPATSIIVQHKLGLQKNCAAFDINLGCSSYPYGLAVLGSFMHTLGIKRALLLVGDVSSRLCSYNDKSAWPLFGDAGSATALELDETAEPIHFDLNSDGSGKDAIIIASGGLASKLPATPESFADVEVSHGVTRNSSNLQLKGTDIFSFAISSVPSSVKRCLGAADWSVQDVDYFVLHQANKMINDFIRKKLGYEEKKEISTLKNYGNTSSVSIPLTLSSASAQLQAGGRILLSGFGVGLSWASCTVTLKEGTILNLFETDNVY